MKNKKDIQFFSVEQKMADVVIQNYKLIQLAARFGIKLGFGDKSVREVCQSHNVCPDFFVLVCNVYTYQNFLPDAKSIANVDINSLLLYLKTSHNYYLNNKLKHIEDCLNILYKDSDKKYAILIDKFFKDYKQEVKNHFDFEEQVVFPYIDTVIHKQKQAGFCIMQFEDNHTNIEDKLSDLKNILIKYFPDSNYSEERMDILHDLFSLEEDLQKHTLIENKILVPYVLKKESDYEQ